MSKLNVRLGEINSRLHSAKANEVIHKTLEQAHTRLSRAGRGRTYAARLRVLTEEALRALSTSLGLDSFADEPSHGIRTLSITGRIIVVDIGFDVNTSEVKSCTLVLATDDGLQDEITADGRDTLFRELVNHELDSFAHNLAKLAFLDRHSDPSAGLNLFYAQDLLRDALNRKLANRLGFSNKPIESASHLRFVLPYHHACPRHDSQAETKPTLGTKTGKVYEALIEIEVQPLANHNVRKMEYATADKVALHPVLHYPKSWVDSTDAWLPVKQFEAARRKEDLRYAVVFEPSIVVPASLVRDMAGASPSKIDSESCGDASTQLYRQVNTPTGIQSITTIVECNGEQLKLCRIAFSHPKELEVILALARQHAMCQHIISTLGETQDIQKDEEGALASTTHWRLEKTYVEDLISAIDDRRSILLSLSKSSAPKDIVATILIEPDSNLKCWHAIDEVYFKRALTMIEDLPIAMLATAVRSPHKSTKPAESSLVDGADPIVRMDFRRDPHNASSRALTGPEAKQGFAYMIPVEGAVETSVAASIDPQSPGFLAHLGQSLRAANLNT